LSPIDGSYTSFYRNPVVGLALALDSLALYANATFVNTPFVFHPRFRDVPLELDQYHKPCSAVSQVAGLISHDVIFGGH